MGYNNPQLQYFLNGKPLKSVEQQKVLEDPYFKKDIDLLKRAHQINNKYNFKVAQSRKIPK